MQITFLTPQYVTDYYGRSAFNLLAEKTSHKSLLNECNSNTDILFCMAFFDSQMHRNFLNFKKKYKNIITINYLWDLPFWRASNPKDKFIRPGLRDLFKTRSYPLLLKNWYEQYSYYLRSSNKLLTSSQHTSNEVMKYYGLNSKPLYLYFPDEDIVNLDHIKKEENTILYSGRLEPYKRVDVLIKAMDKLRNKPYNLNIVGRGSQHIPLLKLVKELKLEQKVKFSGYLPRQQLHEEMKRAFLYVSPTIMEGNPGWGPCEAATCGTSVLMADIPETKEFFLDNASYFNADNCESLSNQIQTLMDNKILNEKLAKKSRDQISFYSLENGVKRFDNFILEILKN